MLLDASHPSVPGASVREKLLKRGAELERQRIVAMLEAAFLSQKYEWDWDEPNPKTIQTKWVRFKGDVIALIKGEKE